MTERTEYQQGYQDALDAAQTIAANNAILFAEWLVVNGYTGSKAYLPLAMFRHYSSAERTSAAALYRQFKSESK